MAEHLEGTDNISGSEIVRSSTQISWKRITSWLRTWTGFETSFFLMLVLGLLGACSLGAINSSNDATNLGLAGSLLLCGVMIDPAKPLIQALRFGVVLYVVCWQWTYFYRTYLGIAQGFFWMVVYMAIVNLTMNWRRFKQNDFNRLDVPALGTDVTNGHYD